MDADNLIPLREAAQFFPKPPCHRTLVNRVRVGCQGIRLKAEFDGYRYWTKQQWVKDYLVEVSEARKLRIDHLKAPIESRTERVNRAYERALRL